MPHKPHEDDNLLDALNKRLGGEPSEPETASQAPVGGAGDTPEEPDTQILAGDAAAKQTTPEGPATQVVEAGSDEQGGSGSSGSSDEQSGSGDEGESGDENGTGEGVKAKKKRRWPIVVGAVVALLGLGYVGAAYALQDQIPKGITVSGVPVGGMSKDEAYAAVDTGLAEAVTTPRQVTPAPVAGTDEQPAPDHAPTAEVDPATISLAVDLDETFDGLVGFSLHPKKMLAHVMGGANIDAVLATDEAALNSEVDRLATELALPAQDAGLTISGAAASVQPASLGVDVVKDDAGKAITSQWLAGDAPIQLPTSAVEPELTTKEMEDFVAEAVAPLLSGPISITVKETLIELSPEQTGQLIQFSAEGGTPSLTVNEESFAQLVGEHTGEVLSVAKDATIAIEAGAPVITPSQDGETVDFAKLSEGLLGVANSGDRTVVAEIITQEAEFSTADAEALGIKEVVSSISTPLTSDSVRTTNLVVGTAKINNTLVKPGEQFNLGDALGPVDAEHGFVSSGVVANGFNSTAMGGGLSQLSTNTFNIGYRAGMVDVAHRPHTKYFSRYPAGLEATLWGEQIPMIWENNTPYGALVEAWVEGGQVHTRLWSTKYWDVEVWQGERHSYVRPQSRVNTAADCEPHGAGESGFSITVGRKVSLNGEVKEDSSYSWTYEPVHAVTCG
ncbi:VanW family protein [Trueperella bialowiezensis]|uniref:Uncharacterized vancomycin resistance protein n=1 Tax=Trueperella bialowiezensis TaxID=312285 RepID=A0A3S4V695_9ACTO|nr:VanW family protein [Trueperella bialowiezensis]VEI12948.1 Uncharacterized vancomycin resistance protein [Trueperella bialowiezensis]